MNGLRRRYYHTSIMIWTLIGAMQCTALLIAEFCWANGDAPHFLLFLHVFVFLALVYSYLSKSAPIGDQHKIHRPLRFFSGVYGVVWASICGDRDLR